MNKRKRLFIYMTLMTFIINYVFGPIGCETKVSASTLVQNINLGTVGLKNPELGPVSGSADDVWRGSKLYYGVEGTLWRVLDEDGLLFADNNLIDKYKYHNADEAMTWKQTSLRSCLNGNTDKVNTEYETYNFLSKYFTDEERNSILEKEISTQNNPIHSTSGGENSRDKLFLLSLEDVTNRSYGFAGDTAISGTRDSSFTWWLRSPGNNPYFAMTVIRVESYIDNKDIVVDGRLIFYDYGVRPAFYLDMESVLYTSAAANIKGEFDKVGDDHVKEDTWKVTLKSDDYFAASIMEETDSNITITHTQASSISSQYSQISAMIINEAQQVLYYGKIGDKDDDLSTLTIPENLPDGEYQVKVFAETLNGER